mmetsp:Transcript_17011/g.28246  ORF Transcript_17011/g.28246 Transcript_17011/m.28246 type:complete len:156 (+) Transcript_17011:198-665(+)
MKVAFSRNSQKKKTVETIQGIGPKADLLLEALGVKSMEDLATYKYFLMARFIVTLAESETEGGRPTGSSMNIDKAVDKDWEAKSFKEIAEAPTSALEGLSEKARELLTELHVKTVKDLANFKYCRYAEAIMEAAKYEEAETAGERKVSAAMKKLE